MDPYGSEGELLNIRTAFYQGQYSEVAAIDISGFSSANQIKGRALQYRASIQLGGAHSVSLELQSATEPELLAVKALADYKDGKEEEAVETCEDLIQVGKGNDAVIVPVATVLVLADQRDKALEILRELPQSLEGTALTVQIHLLNNRTDLAKSVVKFSKGWAQDNILINIAESWIGLRVGGEAYQQSYYVFEELAGTSTTSSITSVIGMAVSELHLGRVEEAEQGLKDALLKNESDSDALANYAVLKTITGQDSLEQVNALKNVNPSHPFLVGSEEKSELFDKAASKYTIKV
jgi:coatomer protein complex subunit epsilon